MGVRERLCLAHLGEKDTRVVIRVASLSVFGEAPRLVCDMTQGRHSSVKDLHSSRNCAGLHDSRPERCKRVLDEGNVFQSDKVKRGFTPLHGLSPSEWIRTV